MINDSHRRRSWKSERTAANLRMHTLFLQPAALFSPTVSSESSRRWRGGGGVERWRGGRKKSILRKWRLRSIAGGYDKGVCTQAQCISHATRVLVLHFLKRHTSSWLLVDLRSSQLWAAALDFSFRGSVSDITSLRVHIKCMHIIPQSCFLFPATLLTCKSQFGAPLLQAYAIVSIKWFPFVANSRSLTLCQPGRLKVNELKNA